jgi:hypothetical protein
VPMKSVSSKKELWALVLAVLPQDVQTKIANAEDVVAQAAAQLMAQPTAAQRRQQSQKQKGAHVYALFEEDISDHIQRQDRLKHIRKMKVGALKLCLAHLGQEAVGKKKDLLATFLSMPEVAVLVGEEEQLSGGGDEEVQQRDCEKRDCEEATGDESAEGVDESDEDGEPVVVTRRARSNRSRLAHVQDDSSATDSD